VDRVGAFQMIITIRKHEYSFEALLFGEKDVSRKLHERSSDPSPRSFRDVLYSQTKR
jgi:hypothetical protein